MFVPVFPRPIKAPVCHASVPFSGPEAGLLRQVERLAPNLDLPLAAPDFTGHHRRLEKSLQPSPPLTRRPVELVEGCWYRSVGPHFYGSVGHTKKTELRSAGGV